jgi:hypothetical protein
MIHRQRANGDGLITVSRQGFANRLGDIVRSGLATQVTCVQRWVARDTLDGRHQPLGRSLFAQVL